MKKNKGRIHPAPLVDAAAALSLLPAAALALAARLGAGDREVLAYLVTRSMAAAAGVVAAGPHEAAFGCGCFDCYTGYWLRWDSSPDRELIHRAIEAFEEQLGSSEKRRRRDRKGRNKVCHLEKRRLEEEEEERKRLEEEQEERKRREEEEELRLREEELRMREDKGEEEEAEAMEVEVEGERRRGWADVMDVLNWRLWSLWSPGD